MSLPDNGSLAPGDEPEAGESMSEGDSKKKRKVEEVDEASVGEVVGRDLDPTGRDDHPDTTTRRDDADAARTNKDAGTQELDVTSGMNPEAASPAALHETATTEDRGISKGSKKKKAKASSTSKKKKKKVIIEPIKGGAAEEREESVLEEEELDLDSGPTAQQEDGEEEAEGEEEDDDKLYCICRTLFYEDEARSMLACDCCDEWYHAACMNIGEEKVKFVDQFICSLCEPKTTQRTTMKQPCSRLDCDGIAPWPLSKYCSEECGLLVAVSRIAKIKPSKGVPLPKTADKLLQAPGLKIAKKTEGKMVWTPGEDKRKWLESIMGYSVSASVTDDAVQRLEDVADLEELTRLEKKKISVDEKIHTVNQSLDVLEHRTTILKLSEDRVSSLERVGEEEGVESRANAKKSKGKKIKQEDEDDKSLVQGRAQGQLRCGYDERLSWDDEHLRSWSKTEEARKMLDEKIPLDGSLFIEGEENETDSIKICGQSKRKCKRHGDWSVIRGADMEAEKELQSNLATSLEEEEQALSRRIAELKSAIQGKLAWQEEKERQQDVLLARQLAKEGSRRSIYIP